MNYLLKERKEVESDSVSVHHRDSEVAVSVAVFDDVDVSKSINLREVLKRKSSIEDRTRQTEEFSREDQGRYAPESKKFQNPVSRKSSLGEKAGLAQQLIDCVILSASFYLPLKAFCPDVCYQGLSSIATYSKTKTAATLASVCSYSEDRGIPGGKESK
ncbi:hypothetical protein KY289_009182 [Solanum tuberosum]|nr:hypothetical protein KY289_009182 [Solanum tuberosum]